MTKIVSDIGIQHITSDPKRSLHSAEHRIGSIELTGYGPTFQMTLPPYSSISLRMEVLAPKVEGLTLVQEGCAWFDDIDATNACSAIAGSVAQADAGNSSGPPDQLTGA